MRKMVKIFRILLVICLIIIGGFWLFPYLFQPQSVKADPGWYDSNWLYRKKITIDNTKINADLSNFPVLISLGSDSDLAADAQDDGDDIIFTSSDETTKLDHEIEFFDGATGQLIAWVKILSLSSSTDTEIYMYYGNSGAPNQENVIGVWDSNFKMVQHLQETSGTHYDSTINSNNGIIGGLVNQNVTGKIDGADEFAGGTDDIDIDTLGVDTSAGAKNTVVFWMRWDGTNSVMPFGWNTTYDLWFRDGCFGFNTGQGNVFGISSAGLANNWVHVAAVFYNGVPDSTNNELYINGIKQSIFACRGTTSSSKTVTTTAVISGWRQGTGYKFDGIIDEVRISNIARLAEWISTSYNNQNNPGVGGFLKSIGGEEEEAVTILAPTVTNSTGASNITDTSARLNGEVTDTGGENPTVSVYWGDNDGGTNPANWDNVDNLGIQSLGAFFDDISPLNPSTTYYYRCYATNSGGDDWANSTAQFTTLVAPPPPPSNNVSGWAWSETIGWISFNCDDTGTCGTSDYGVNVDPVTGNFSGYAWSENIGWIDFAPVSSYPAAPGYSARYDSGTDEVNGWARACVVFQTGCLGVLRPDSELGGWDGWILLGDETNTWVNQIIISPATNQMQGWAWGSDVIGWIDFGYQVVAEINDPPTATNLNKTDPDWCGSPPSYFFSWTYSDPNGDDELQFDFQIDTDPLFPSPVEPVDRDYPGLSNPSPSQNNQTVLVAVSVLDDYLTYGQTYYWRVRVWDSRGANSGWVNGSSFTTQPHAWPSPDFTSIPESPVPKEGVQFTDQSTCYDNNSAGSACDDDPLDPKPDSFSWTFQDANPANSAIQNPVTTFLISGNKQVILTVTDFDGYSCLVAKTVSVNLPLPKWKEIKPW